MIDGSVPDLGARPGHALDPELLVDPTAPEWDALLRRALLGEGVRSLYQPVVDVARRVIAGYEALTRFDLVPGLTPDHWFAAATARDLVPELELVTLGTAMTRQADLPPNTFMTVNVEPGSVFDPAVRRLLLTALSTGRLVLEITEHRQIDDPERFVAALDNFRAAGALIAVDDAGTGHSGLQQILLLRPSILKLDRALVSDVDVDEAKAALVEMMGMFANRVDAWLLAEGVETLGEARRVHELGVPLAQGYFYARPAEPWADMDQATRSSLPSSSESRSGGLHRLVAQVPCVNFGEHDLAIHQLGPSTPIIVVLDPNGRAAGLLTLDSAMTESLADPLRVNVHTTPVELAHRISTRVPADTAAPVVVTDHAGRYVGVVHITRLLQHLAASD